MNENEPPCLCSEGYRCNRCRTADWHAKWEPTRRKMRDNKLKPLADDKELIDDDQWSIMLRLNGEPDDLDRLLEGKS